ncbi:MAG TPA: PfkB family carbohydrate kinase [Candidatus Dormibacteraeota bacterium]
MTWDVAVAGTFHSDDLTTPAGRRDALGGSAVYFSLAASRYAPVHVNGIVGADTVDEYRRILDSPSIHLDGMVVSDSPTFRWHAVHDFHRWVTSHESSEPGCDPLWDATLSEPSRSADVLFVGSMAPALQRAVIDQSGAALIGLDSMTEFIEHQRGEVNAVLRRIDILFLTAAELSALTDSDDWRGSAARLCGTGRLRAVVVKHGPEGAACVTSDMLAEMPAVAVRAVVDPTGAGDALAGGFLGHIAQAMRSDEAILAAALAEGLARAAEAIVAFGTAGLAGTGTV